MTANAAMVNMLQDRLSSLVHSSSGYVESLPTRVRRRVTALEGVQAKQGEVENQFHKEVFALEKRYAGLFQPLYDRRSELVSGAGAPPTEEELATGKEAEASFNLAAEGDEKGQEVAASEEQKGADDEPKGLPDFWLTVLSQHPRIADLITEPDEAALRALTDVRLSYLPDETPGFRLSFHFAENDIFANEVLVKTYYYQTECAGGELLYDRAEGTKIDWKADKNLTVKVEVKRQRHKGTGKTREVKKTVPAESFFNFFSPPRIPEDGNGDDDEENNEIEEQLELDYEVGEELKDKVIPHAVDWFTGRALLFEQMDEPYDEDEDEFEGDDDEDESNDEDEEDAAGDDNVQPSSKDEKPPECKQQ